MTTEELLGNNEERRKFIPRDTDTSARKRMVDDKCYKYGIKNPETGKWYTINFFGPSEDMDKGEWSEWPPSLREVRKKYPQKKKK